MRRELIYLHLRGFGVGWDVAIVVLGDFGFCLADVFAGGVEGCFRHVDGMI